MGLSVCRLGGFRCRSDGWWGFVYVGQEGFRKVGSSGGLIFGVDLVERCGGWVYLGLFRGVWPK